MYFVYDPALKALSLGIVSALKEIELTKIVAIFENWGEGKMGKRVYSLGLYIHECPKMRYKGTFKPSFLLCHESRKFVEFSLAKPCLEEHAMRLLPHGEIQWLSQREEEEEKEKMLLVFVYEERTVMTYKRAVEKYGEAVEKKLKEYLPLLSPPPPSSVFIITLEWIVCVRDDLLEVRVSSVFSQVIFL